MLLLAYTCPFGFFFDESVKNCWPCESVCGRNGLNQQECSSRCQEYTKKRQMSTTGVDLPDSSESLVKLDVWLVPAIASATVAFLSIAVVVAIFWKLRKSIRAMPPFECEEISLMDGGIRQESVNASFNMETTRVPTLTSEPLTIPKTVNSSSNFSPIQNSTSLSEDRSALSQPCDNVCGDKLFDSCDLSSPISLKCDPSFPRQLNMADVDDGLKFSSGSVVSSVHDMLHMFGWLNNTDWVVEYREDATGLHVGVEGIGKEKAEEMIWKKGHRLQDFHFVVTSPSKGQFIPCPFTGINTSPTVKQSLMAAQILKPGIRIYSKEMEPDLDTGTRQPGHAIYSGSLRSGGGNIVGLTVGHLFAQECLELSLDNKTPIGKCLRKCDSVVHHTLSKVTADLALLEILLPTENMICFDRRNYKLKLFKNELSVKPPSHIPIIILRSDGTFSKGQISNSMFTYKKCGLFNTLCIVDSDDNPNRISNEGDSGSLILSWPTPSSEYLFVYGMAIGYWINDEETHSHTVATRLWNVLETLWSDCDLDFSNETHDSGFDAYS